VRGRERVIRALLDGNSTLKDISHAAKLDESTAHKTLKLLMEEGLVERVGWGKYRLIEVPSVLTELPKIETPTIEMPKFFFRTEKKKK